MFCAENWVWTQVRRTSLCPWRVNPQPGGPNRSAAPTGRPGEEQKKKKRAMTSPTRPGQSRPEEQFCYSPVTPPDPQSFALLWGTDTDPGGGPHRQHQPGKQDQRKTRPVSGNLTKRHVFFLSRSFCDLNLSVYVMTVNICHIRLWPSPERLD